MSAEPPRRRFRPPLAALWRLFGMQVCGVVLIVVGTIVRVHLAVVIMASFLVLVSLLRAWWEPSRTTRWMAWSSAGQRSPFDPAPAPANVRSMAVATYTCIAEGCAWVQESSTKEAGTDAVVDERAAHNATLHAGEAGFAARETWPWLLPLFAVNVIWLIVSAVAAVAPWGAVVLFAPQVGMMRSAPWFGLIEILIILLTTLAYATRAPEGVSVARRAFAGLTMSAFLVMIGNAVLVFAMLGFSAVAFRG